MPKLLSLREAIQHFGAEAKAKLANPSIKGAPEDQLRGPLEHLVKDLAELCNIPRGDITAVGETSIAALQTRPDYAVTRGRSLIGFIEVKAPGKGADPRHWKAGSHDRAQWEKIRSLPNLLYTDGNAFSLWRSGEIVDHVIHLEGDIAASGAGLDAPPRLLALFEDFFGWQPVAPRTARELAETSARLCRLLREEVTEHLALKSPALTVLAHDWRDMLFPEATDAQFADGYAQAVTFGLLVARAYDISLQDGLDRAAKKLGASASLIGAALRILTDDAGNQASLVTSIGTLTRVLDAVDWRVLSEGNEGEAWLYFYEDFLAVYDNALRKQTGSYYTPPEVVGAMVRLVDDALRARYDLPDGLASPEVTVVDPAVGTGTFVLGILRHIAGAVTLDQGAGAVPAAIAAAVQRIVAFELQLGPFAVAQLRVLGAVAELTGGVSTGAPRMYVTDTLGDPFVEETHIPGMYEAIGRSRREANKVKRDERITVVLGNPPYKEKARGKGAWVESGNTNTNAPAPLDAWLPPPTWGVGAHAKHLRNLYVYFWRWATWKVYDHDPAHRTGIVCFITVAGFLNGPGFQRMREYMRRTCDEVWVIDCSPEGHQPDVPTRVFEGVQQPVCIVLASRSPNAVEGKPARVRFRALPAGNRLEKFTALQGITLDGTAWERCANGWREPFLPTAKGAWATFPALTDLFVYHGSGVMPGRTWVIAPDKDSLERRWQALVNAPDAKKEALFHPHLRNNKPGDKHLHKTVPRGLAGHPFRGAPVAGDHDACIPPTRYAFRSFDRQWIIPDCRVLNQPNPELWQAHSKKQVYFTALLRRSPSSGPALTVSGLIPDHDHYKGSFSGRVFPLWLDHAATVSNLRPAVLAALGERYGAAPSSEDMMAYLAAVLAQPAFTRRFLDDLRKPGIRVPITADGSIFRDAAAIGRTVIWLHSYGERFTDASAGRPARSPGLPQGTAPTIPAGGAIQGDDGGLPDAMDYDPGTRKLRVGKGYVDNVPPEVWAYEVSGKNVLRQWFSYRRKDRERPLMGDRRPPSKLGEIQPAHWPSEYTTDLLDLLNVIAMLIELEPQQAAVLERICAGPTIADKELREVVAYALPAGYPTSPAALRDASASMKTGQTSFLQQLEATIVDTPAKGRKPGRALGQ